MNVGTERISSQQRDLLNHATRTDVGGLLAQLLDRISGDDDILEGLEDLHPRWLEIFGRMKGDLATALPTPVFSRIEAFFSKFAPYDAAVHSIDPRTQRVAFLLGAGASKPGPSDIPTVQELLPQLLERARRLDREDVTQLADFCERRGLKNIEDLLTAAHLATFCSRSPNVLRLLQYLLYRDARDEVQQRELWEVSRPVARRPLESSTALASVAFLQDTLQALFSLLSNTMLPAKPNNAHQAIAQYAKNHAGSSVVTTNYDCCMDLALEDVQDQFSYRVDFANDKAHSTKDEQRTRLVKLHGSLNWFYCETCQEVQLIDIRPLVEAFLRDKALYPVTGVCKDCGGQRRGLLVPPLAMTFDVAPPLTPLLGDANNAFERADLIVVVGFSFADADAYISRMIGKAMQISAAQRVIVVDPDYQVTDRIRRKFRASIPNFDVNRIVRIASDCNEALPMFLSGELFRPVLDVVSGGHEGPKRAAV